MPGHRQGALIFGAPLNEAAALRSRFVAQTLQNPHNAALVERLSHLDLPDAWLVAGCLFQSVWNLQAGRSPEAGIADYDVFYVDDHDLSAQAEQQVQARVNALCADLGVVVEAKNQARVHLWYEQWFGFAYAPLTQSRDGIGRFLVRGTCVGLAISPAAAALVRACQPWHSLGDLQNSDDPPSTEKTEARAALAALAEQHVHAPNGLEDLYAGLLRPNPACPHMPLFDAKALSYQGRWPWLVIEPTMPSANVEPVAQAAGE